MIKVTIHSTEVRNQSGVSKTTNRPYNMDFQEAWLHLYDKAGKPEPYPVKIEISLEHNEQGAALFYKLGEYQLHPSSVYVDRSGNLAIKPRLQSVAKPTAAA